MKITHYQVFFLKTRGMLCSLFNPYVNQVCLGVSFITCTTVSYPAMLVYLIHQWFIDGFMLRFIITGDTFESWSEWHQKIVGNFDSPSVYDENPCVPHLFLSAVNIDITQRKEASPLGIWELALIKAIYDVIQFLFKRCQSEKNDKSILHTLVLSFFCFWKYQEQRRVEDIHHFHLEMTSGLIMFSYVSTIKFLYSISS